MGSPTTAAKTPPIDASPPLGKSSRGASEGSDTRERFLVDRGLRGREVAGDANKRAPAEEVVLGAKESDVLEGGLNVGRAALRVFRGGVDLDGASALEGVGFLARALGGRDARVGEGGL